MFRVDLAQDTKLNGLGGTVEYHVYMTSWILAYTVVKLLSITHKPCIKQLF